MMGSCTASYTSHTIRTATGNTAGPDSPPVRLAMRGFFVFRSIRIPNRVLMRQMPSAPASAQALAISAMSVTLGESFMKTRFFVTAFTVRVTSAAALGSEPKFFPPAWTLGQEMFTSRMDTCSTSLSLAQFSAYSWREKPPTLAITGP